MEVAGDPVCSFISACLACIGSEFDFQFYVRRHCQIFLFRKVSCLPGERRTGWGWHSLPSSLLGPVWTDPGSCSTPASSASSFTRRGMCETFALLLSCLVCVCVGGVGDSGPFRISLLRPLPSVKTIPTLLGS